MDKYSIVAHYKIELELYRRNKYYMTQTIKNVVGNTRQLYMSPSAIEHLLDFERVLDSLNLYVFDNWLQGELVEGPVVKKYFVSCKFMWPLHKMPDPSGGEKLLKYSINITYEKDELEIPVKVQTEEDFEDGTKYPKMVKKPVWIVEIEMPKKLMGEIKRGSVEVEDEDIDMSDLEKAYENDIDKESYEIDNADQSMQQNNQDQMQPAQQGQAPGGMNPNQQQPM